ncbi:MAG: FixH family protein [Bacteroidota bacterium]
MNWGYKLMVTFIVFAGMMGYLVYRAFGTNFELVGKDYYKDELRYQQVIDGSDRANLLKTSVEIKQSSDKIILQMPEEMKDKNISGTVLFYCAYDSKKDKNFILTLNNEGTQAFSSGEVTPGTYIVKLNWDSDGKNYYAERKLTVL